MDYNTLNKVRIHASIEILIYINKREWKISLTVERQLLNAEGMMGVKKMGAKISGQMFDEDRIFTLSKYVKYITTN